MSISANIHKVIKAEAMTSCGHAWLQLQCDDGSYASVHLPSFEQAKRMADAFSAETECCKGLAPAFECRCEIERKAPVLEAAE